MQNFDFQNPTRILFGQGRIADLDKVVPKDVRVLVLYGGGSIKSNGVFDEVKAALGERHVQEFSGIEPNPSFETMMRAVELVKRENIGFLLAVDPILDMGRTAVNVAGQALIPTIVAKREGILDQATYDRGESIEALDGAEAVPAQ